VAAAVPNAPVRGLAVAAEHPHGDNARLLGDTAGASGDGARDVCAVTLAVLRDVVVVDEVETVPRAALEFLVGDSNSGVEHVRGHVLRGVRVLVGRVERKRGLVDPVEVPAGVALRVLDRDHQVAVHLGDAALTR
jgi:hypothetical protein